MSRAFSRLSLAAAPLLLLALPACSMMSAIGGGDARVDAATRTACRQRTNEIYDQRARAEIYAPASGVNTPSSSNYGAGSTNRGLSEQFAYGKLQSECERNRSSDVDRSDQLLSPVKRAR